MQSSKNANAGGGQFKGRMLLLNKNFQHYDVWPRMNSCPLGQKSGESGNLERTFGFRNFKI